MSNAAGSPLAFDMESALNILKKKQQQKGAAGEKRVGCCFPQLQDEFSALVSRDVAGRGASGAQQLMWGLLHVHAFPMPFVHGASACGMREGGSLGEKCKLLLQQEL